MEAPDHTQPPFVAEPLPADPGYVARLAAVRAEPAPDGEPPTPGDLEVILATATTVPDHGDLTPWRFAVCSGTGRERFAQALVAGLRQQRADDPPEAMVTKMASKPYAAPCQVMVVASPDPNSNVAAWEQVASASCTGYAIVLAATGLGYGAVWKSAGVLGSPAVRALFVCSPDEQLLGWVNLGTPATLGRKELVAGNAIDLKARVLHIDA